VLLIVPSRHSSAVARSVPALFLGSQSLKIDDMPYPSKVEVVELLPLPCSRSCGSAVV
jgi:hypothetical protein